METNWRHVVSFVWALALLRQIILTYTWHSTLHDAPYFLRSPLNFTYIRRHPPTHPCIVESICHHLHIRLSTRLRHSSDRSFQRRGGQRRQPWTTTAHIHTTIIPDSEAPVQSRRDLGVPIRIARRSVPLPTPMRTGQRYPTLLSAEEFRTELPR